MGDYIDDRLDRDTHADGPIESVKGSEEQVLGDGSFGYSPGWSHLPQSNQEWRTDTRRSSADMDDIRGPVHGCKNRDQAFGSYPGSTYMPDGLPRASPPDSYAGRHQLEANEPRASYGYGSYPPSLSRLDSRPHAIQDPGGPFRVHDPARFMTPPVVHALPHLSQIAPYLDGNAGRRKQVRRRTKTGCLTCRKRRIKCDETHPACTNCMKSRRTCLGYDPNFRSVHHDDYHSRHPSQQASEGSNAGSSPESGTSRRMKIASLLLDGETPPSPVSAKAREQAAMLDDLFSSHVFAEGLVGSNRNVNDAFNVLVNASGGAYAERQGHVMEAIVWTAVNFIYPVIPVPTILFREEPTPAQAVVLYRVRLLESCVTRTPLPSALVEDELEVWRVMRKVVEGREDVEWHAADGMEKVVQLLSKYRHCMNRGKGEEALGIKAEINAIGLVVDLVGKLYDRL